MCYVRHENSQNEKLQTEFGVILKEKKEEEKTRQIVTTQQIRQLQ